MSPLALTIRLSDAFETLKRELIWHSKATITVGAGTSGSMATEKPKDDSPEILGLAVQITRSVKATGILGRLR